jgi:DNA-binding PadR family transcriptional regulator
VNPRPRKIYELTSLGKKVLNEMKKTWQQYGKTIEGIINDD